MVGSAILKELESQGYHNIISAHRDQLDLTRQKLVNNFFRQTSPQVVVICAAKVGGIHANNEYRADFIYENLQIQNNLIHSAYEYNVKKLLFLGSSCIYPKFADQPIKEEYLLTSPLEYTNEPYAIAKIAGIKMCESYHKQYGCNFLSVMPTNLYGPNDNFHPKNSHVLPGLLRRFHEAWSREDQEVEVWGTGKAKREFLHIEDLANACTFILKNVEAKDVYKRKISHLNIGTGKDISIANLAKLISKTVNYRGKIKFELNKPDGTLRKLLDVSRLEKMGWKSKIELEDGLNKTYEWLVENEKNIRSI
jgi:GDP-L-fucose synthase